jgi:hypothetical protein
MSAVTKPTYWEPEAKLRRNKNKHKQQFEIVAKGFRNYNNNAVPIYRREDQLQEEQEENKNRLKNISKKKQTDRQTNKTLKEKKKNDYGWHVDLLPILLFAGVSVCYDTQTDRQTNLLRVP